MGPRTLALAFALSLAAALLAGPRGDAELSRAALALVPWLALAGLPRSRPGTSAFALVGILAPALALAAAVDWGSGLAPARIALTAAQGLALVLLLGLAAERGRGALYGALWWLLVPGAAALGHALRGVGSGNLDAALAAALDASPPAWALAAARAEVSVLPPLVSVLVLAVVAGSTAARAPAAGAPVEAEGA